MTRLLKRRTHIPIYYDARSQRPRIIREARVKRCGTCTYEIPEGDIVREDGREVCPMCKDTLTAEWKARETSYVAGVREEAVRRLFQPPQVSIRPLQETIPSAVTSITNSAGVWLSQSTPLNLIRGVAATLLLNGVRFSSTDTITYSTGITDSSSPTRTSSLTTLSVVADPGMSAGSYSLTFNGHVYRNIFSVR